MQPSRPPVRTAGETKLRVNPIASDSPSTGIGEYASILR